MRKLQNLAPNAYNIFCKPKSPELPDFLVIGAQKAATSWIFIMLKHHPDVFLAHPKELHYFDQHKNKNILWYSYFFRNSAGKVKGEATPNYLSLDKRSIEHIKLRMPNVKIIISLRNPIYRDWSAAIMHMTKSQIRQSTDVSIDDIKKDLMTDDVKRNGDYVSSLNKWFSVFDKRQIHILLYEDIQNKPEISLEKIFSHIGVCSSVDFSRFPTSNIVNKNPYIAMPNEVHSMLYHRHKKNIKRLYAMLKDERILQWLEE